MGAVPHRVMWMHLYGAGSSSWPTAGEGVNEASYHRTPACSPKLIQSVPDQTEEKNRNIQHPNLLWKDGCHSVFVRPLCRGQSLTYINNAGSFSKRKEVVLITWRWQALRQTKQKIVLNKVSRNAGLHSLSLNIPSQRMTFDTLWALRQVQFRECRPIEGGFVMKTSMWNFPFVLWDKVKLPLSFRKSVSPMQFLVLYEHKLFFLY